MVWSNAMDCKEMILSEDTYDIITDFSASEFLGDDNNCYERIGEDFLILYLANLGIRNPKMDFFPLSQYAEALWAHAAISLR